MTFKSLTKAQQRELLRAYEYGGWLAAAPAGWLTTYERLADRGYIWVNKSGLFIVTAAGRELVARHLRDQQAKADFERRFNEASEKANGVLEATDAG